eukprot:760093_1
MAHSIDEEANDLISTFSKDELDMMKSILCVPRKYDAGDIISVMDCLISGYFRQCFQINYLCVPFDISQFVVFLCGNQLRNDIIYRQYIKSNRLLFAYKLITFSKT